MSDIWRVFWIRNCVHTIPQKDKWVVIACKDRDCMGFFINKGINTYIQKRPTLLLAQVPIKKNDYGFLVQDSFVDCQKLYSFNVEELNNGRGNLLDETIVDIKKVVAESVTLEQYFIDLILRS